MNKKGFTLIELLATLIILAIIATITIPVVTNIINNARESSNRKSVTLYGRQIENEIKTYMASHNGKVPSGEYIADDTGRTLTNKQDNIQIVVDVKGNNIKCGTITIDEKGNAYLNQCKVNDDYVYVEGSKSLFSYGDKTYKNGEVVYFNVTTGSKCESTDYKESQSNTGVNNGCMKFYAFNDNGGNTVNLILDHNTTGLVQWNSSGGTVEGPNEIMIKLKTDTSSWEGTETPKNYTLNELLSSDKIDYTVNYTGYKARIITAQEVAKITGNISLSNTKLNLENYSWLLDNTANANEKYGYWTVTAATGNEAWYIRWAGEMGYSSFYNANREGVESSIDYGIRPVIEVLRSNLS